MTAFKVGDKVTVVTTHTDPPHLECNPSAFIVEVQDGDRGPRYWVGHLAAGNFPATRFGPFPGARLKAGW